MNPPPEVDGFDLEKSEDEDPEGFEAEADEAAAGRCWLCPSNPVIPPKRDPC